MSPGTHSGMCTFLSERGGSYAIIWGSVRHVFCRAPLISTDFYAIRTPIVWHILGAFFFANMGGGGGQIENVINQKRSGDPNPQYFFKKYCRTNGGRTAVQMGGVLQYKWEAYCRASLSSKLRSQESTAIQMGGVLPYKLEVYCRTF